MASKDVYGDDRPTAAKPSNQAAGGLSLRVIAPDHVQTHPLPVAGQVLIGRGAKVDVLIADASVSRRHAMLHIGTTSRIEDLGSRHGTKLGGRTLQAKELCPLELGQPVELGSVVVMLQRQAAREEGPPSPRDDAGRTVSSEPAMIELSNLIDRFAPGNISVLLLGETGVGKEVTAERIHQRSRRAAQPLLRLNCAALSESLLESELFGHERGAFTGAVATKVGLLETAQGGTVFLDEIGDIPQTLQVKLLRVLEERRVTRVGGLKSAPIDVRFIAATNRDLEADATSGRFRQDLYFRLNGVSLHIPPLRERRSEIEPLARSFIAEFAAQAGFAASGVSPEASALLGRYAWPGNIRELRNLVERAVLLAAGELITPSHFPVNKMHGAPPPPSAVVEAPATPPDAELWSDVEKLERERILDALQKCAGNQSRAAKMLGISRGTLGRRIAAFGLPRPRSASDAD